jgi:1,4-dihydroxy-6-naphthoate synthase
MKISVGFSPCPNDTFIFDALVNHKIDTEGFEFEVYMEDVETLNTMAFEGRLDMTKLSFHTFAYVTESYNLMHAGSALGQNCGPLLISKKKIEKDAVKNGSIGIPGKFTTANLLFSIAYPEATNKVAMLFSEIENQLIQEKIDVGVIIHENRFTYAAKGLHKITDLGEYWESNYHHPIPLGGIFVHNRLDFNTQIKLDKLLKKSILYAFENKKSVMPYVRAHSQEMDEAVMLQHIALYVNDYTIDLGTKGIDAVKKLFEVGKELGLIDSKDFRMVNHS